MSIITFYAYSEGLQCGITALQSSRAQKIGGLHLHQMFCLDVKKNMNPYNSAFQAIARLDRNPTKKNWLQSVNILFIDELGQVSCELLCLLDIILRSIRQSTTYLGGVLLICTMDHKQLCPINETPVLISSQIPTAFTFITLEKSIRASNDTNFQRIQDISRMHPSKYLSEPSILQEFENLLKTTCTFVTDWSDPVITNNTFRLYAKKFPAKEATKLYQDQVRATMINNISGLRSRHCIDIEKQANCREDWLNASESTSNALDQRCKELRSVLFFRGAIYECTYNKPNKFSQSQLALLYDLPTQEDLDQFRPIKVLIAPPGVKNFEFDEDKDKTTYLDEGWVQVTISNPEERTHLINGRIQCQRKQYGLKHRVTSTIHACMGDTLHKVAIEISDNDPYYKLWDKAQAVVMLSRTRLGCNTIFVGNQKKIIDAMISIITIRNQWTEYMERVLDVVCINRNDNESIPILTQEANPFRICDTLIPNCNTGFVYFIVSVTDPSFSYIGQSLCLKTRLQRHNSGSGSLATSPARLRPFALYAYICGFDCNKNLMLTVESSWQSKRNTLISHGVTDRKQLATCATHAIDQLYGPTLKEELRLITLF